MREEYKVVDIGGRSFRVGRLNPMVGSYIAAKLTAVLLPLMGSLTGSNKAAVKKIQGGANIKEVAPKINLDKIDLGSIFTALPMDEFVRLQMELLKPCAEMLPAGLQEVVNSNGSIGILDADVGLIMRLTLESVKWNFADFFSAAGQALNLK